MHASLIISCVAPFYMALLLHFLQLQAVLDRTNLNHYSTGRNERLALTEPSPFAHNTAFAINGVGRPAPFQNIVECLLFLYIRLWRAMYYLIRK